MAPLPQGGSTSATEPPTRGSGLRSAVYDAREYIRGAGAAFVNIVATFPANKVMFRQQLHGVSARSAALAMYHEGLPQLYRGVVPPLAQRTLSMSIMFGLFDTYRAELHRHFPEASSGPLGEAGVRVAAAVLAGSTEALLAPFERAQTLLQAPEFNRTYSGTLDVFRKLRPHGPGELYRGTTAVLIRNGPSNALFFLLRGPMKEALPPPRTYAGSLVYDFACGSLLGACISTLLYPVNVVKTHMMSRVGGPRLSFPSALGQVWDIRQHSVQRLYRGVHINFTRSCVSWGIINSVYEFLGEYV